MLFIRGLSRGLMGGGLARILLIFSLLSMFFIILGCNEDIRSLDQADQLSPLAQKAKQAADTGDLEGAVKYYRKALDADPLLGRVHLDLALVLHRMEGKRDYVNIMYHYRRYLDLRPDSEKRQMIENRIRLASQTYAGIVLGDSHIGNQPIIKKLEAENERLKQEVDMLQKKNEILKEKILQRSIEEPAQPVEEISAGKRTYKVQYGDTLEGIAEFFYKDAGRAVDIYNHNKALIKDPNSLIAGQVLVIP